MPGREEGCAYNRIIGQRQLMDSGHALDIVVREACHFETADMIMRSRSPDRGDAMVSIRHLPGHPPEFVL